MKIPSGPQYREFILVGEREGEAYNKYEREMERRKTSTYKHNFLPYIDSEITGQTITTFNTSTLQYADNAIYTGKKGDYIKKRGRKLYLKEFVWTTSKSS